MQEKAEAAGNQHRAAPGGGGGGAGHGMLGLHQAAGNAAVAGMVQRSRETPGGRDSGGQGGGTGPVSADQLVEFAKGVEGTTYVFGGVHWGDCSGAVSALANYSTGKDPWGSRFYTGNEGDELAKRGFKPGMGPSGSLKVGWKNGGEGGGHTAATLPNDVHFEMGGARGNGQYGGKAAGAADGMFTDHAHLPPEHFKGGGAAKNDGEAKGEQPLGHQAQEKEQSGAPGGGGAVPGGGDGMVYTIKPGDTLSALAQQFLGDASRYPELAKLNNIPNPDLIYAGATLKVPGGRHVEKLQHKQPADVKESSEGGEQQGGDKDKPKQQGPSQLTAEQLVQAMPGLSQGKAASLIGHLNTAMNEGDITTPQRKAAFLAQLGHESASLVYFEEIASGAAYEGRADLGNTQPGDGVRFKGRGPIQLTGRSNYTAAGRDLGLPLVERPEMVATPEVGFRTTVWYWKTRKLNGYADSGDFEGLTRAINGGTNGMADRLSRWATAKRIFGV